jgi:hypothetical protein
VPIIRSAHDLDFTHETPADIELHLHETDPTVPSRVVVAPRPPRDVALCHANPIVTNLDVPSGRIGEAHETIGDLRHLPSELT